MLFYCEILIILGLVNEQNPKTLWTPLHAATFQEHGPVCHDYQKYYF